MLLVISKLLNQACTQREGHADGLAWVPRDRDYFEPPQKYPTTVDSQAGLLLLKYVCSAMIAHTPGHMLTTLLGLLLWFPPWISSKLQRWLLKLSPGSNMPWLRPHVMMEISSKSLGIQRREIYCTVAYQNTHTGIVQGTWEATVKVLGKKKNPGESPDQAKTVRLGRWCLQTPLMCEEGESRERLLLMRQSKRSHNHWKEFYYRHPLGLRRCLTIQAWGPEFRSQEPT